MRVLTATLIMALVLPEPAAACIAVAEPKPEHITFADSVVKAKLLEVEDGPMIPPDNYGNTRSAILTFAVEETLAGDSRSRWRVLWRGGHVDFVVPADTPPAWQGDAHFDRHRRYKFPSRSYSTEFNGRRFSTTLRIGDEYIVGVVSADRTETDGCRRTIRGDEFCLPDLYGGPLDELLFLGCHGRLPYAFPFSETLEDRVRAALRSVQ